MFTLGTNNGQLTVLDREICDRGLIKVGSVVVGVLGCAVFRRLFACFMSTPDVRCAYFHMKLLFMLFNKSETECFRICCVGWSNRGIGISERIWNSNCRNNEFCKREEAIASHYILLSLTYTAASREASLSGCSLPL